MSIPRPNAYDRKARLYAKCRWDYPQAAIDQICQLAGIGQQSVIADIGCGPGIVARHFLPRAGMVYGVDPGGDMRLVADELLGSWPNFQVRRGSAESTGLSDRSIDLITAGMAIHWFEPRATVREFARILKPDGLVAILRYEIIEQELVEALKQLPRCRNTIPSHVPCHAPIDAFISPDSVRRFVYTTPHREDCERFMGASLSAAAAPAEDDPAFAAFCDAVHRIFHRFAVDDLLTITQRTHLTVGRLTATV